MSHQDSVFAMMAQPGTYGLPPDTRVERIETHGSVLFLAGQRVYKLKKDIFFPYMDFSTVEKRVAAARAEFEVNQRFNPTLYLGLAAVCERDGVLRLSEAAPDICPKRDGFLEPVVVMGRFSDEVQMDRVMARDGLASDLADRLGVMAANIMKQAPVRDLDWQTEIHAVHRENFEELENWPDIFPPERVAALKHHMDDHLEAQAAVLEKRSAQARVRRGHGDLHLRNIICADGEPLPFDALEFDETLATIDTLYDLAFLVMDLIHQGEDGAAARVLAVGLVQTDDMEGVGLMPVYTAIRATIRAKIAATIASQVRTDTRRDAMVAEALEYFALAERLSAPVSPSLIAVGGLSGSGKSTLAFALAPNLAPCAVVVRSDVIRKHLVGVDLFTQAPAETYTWAMNTEVYGQMDMLARQALNAGVPVVLDAVYSKVAEREAAASVAAQSGVPFVGLWLDLPTEDRAQRATTRVRDASDATEAIARRQVAEEPIDWHRLDSGAGQEMLVEAAVKHLLGHANSHC